MVIVDLDNTVMVNGVFVVVVFGGVGCHSDGVGGG